MESAFDSVVTVDNCYVNVRKSANELFRSDLLECDVLRVFNDISCCSLDACIILKLYDAFLFEEQESSCFVCYIVWNCYYSAVRKLVKALCLACVDAERFIVDRTC